MDKPLVNRVANSGIITINLEEYFPTNEVIGFDLKGYLFQEMILKEKDFRAALKEHDWQQYDGKIVTLFCSVDAIIPTWAYMLVSSYCSGIAIDLFQGTKAEYYTYYYKQLLKEMDYTQYQDNRIVIKGCSNQPVPTLAYMEITEKLKPYAQSIMYGEPCSTVPIFKRPRKV
jgi:hypothetical protein